MNASPVSPDPIDLEAYRVAKATRDSVLQGWVLLFLLSVVLLSTFNCRL